MRVDVDWHSLGSVETDEGWDYDRCLYAHVVDNDEIVYIGLAWNASIDERFRNKRAMRKFLSNHGIKDCVTMLGEIDVRGRHLTRQLLGDIESLLIFAEQPQANIQSKRSRTCRPGMTVNCYGSWPCRQRTYYDT